MRSITKAFKRKIVSLGQSKVFVLLFKINETNSSKKNNSLKNKAQLAVLFSSAKMAIATLTSRILGLVREQAIAATFGASGITDAFNVAYRIPNILRDLFAEGAFSAAFVPTFTEVFHKNKEEARSLLWSLFLLLGLITGVLTLGMFIFAPKLVILFAPSFTEDSSKIDFTVNLLRIMSPFLLVISWASLFMGVLNTLKIFFIPSLAPAFFNVVMILSIIFGSKYFKSLGLHPGLSMGFGVILGGLIQLLIQIPLVIKNGFGPGGKIKLISNYSKRILNRLSFGVIGIAATQINVLITTIIATGAGLGAVSWLGYAFRLFQFPVGVAGVSVAGSNLVYFSEGIKKGDYEKANQYLISSFQLGLLVMVLALALMQALKFEIVQMIFERGAFTARDTLQTTKALEFYIWGLPFYGFYKLFVPSFYALDRQKIPVIISIVSIGFNIVFCLLLTPIYGFQILALGTTLSMVLNSTVQGSLLIGILNLKITHFVGLRALKFIVAGLLCYFGVKYCRPLIYEEEAILILKVFSFSGLSFIGVLIYSLSLFILGEGKQLKKVIKRKGSSDQ